MNKHNLISRTSPINYLIMGLIVLVLSMLPQAKVQASGQSLVWREDFGVVADSARSDFSDPNKTLPGHTYQGNMKTDVQDGQYAIANSTRWCLYSGTFFRYGRDHTGNKDGAMLVVNTMGTMEGSIIYEQKVDFPLCTSNDYYFCIYASSITSFDCTPANLELRIVAPDGSTIDSVLTDSIPFWALASGIWSDPHCVRTWSKYGLTFNSKGYKSVTLQIINRAICKKGYTAATLPVGQGCDAGNDFVLDDISLYRIDKDPAPDAVVSAATVTGQSKLTSDCIYTSSYTIPDSTLAAWKKVYPVIYLLWQQSEDGYTWTTMDSQSGVDASTMQADVDITKNMRYRVIITGGMTAAEGKTVAEQIATNGGPTDGCYKFSISNTLAASKPEADCTYSSDLKALFNDDFGTVDSAAFVASPYAKYTLGGKSLTAGQYVVCSNPYYTQKNSWDGINKSTDNTGNTNGGMLVAYCSTTSPSEIYSRTISGPFCNCKTYMFSFMVKNNRSWTDVNLRALVLDGSGDTLSSLPIKIGGAGSPSAWLRYTTSFDLAKNYTGSITVRIENTAKNDEFLLFDDITVRLCGEKVPQDSIYIDNTPGLTSLSGFDCAALPAKTINLSQMSGWPTKYPSYSYLWQSSDDGGTTWTTLSDKTTSINYENTAGGTKQYRAIIAESDVIAKAVAAGSMTDGCGIYLITNTVSLICEQKCEFGDDKLVLWKDNFGSVPAGTRKECANLKGHTFLSNMSKSVDDGQYAVVSRMKDAGSWFAGEGGTDHTGNADGGFLVINISPTYKDKVIYEQTLGFTPCANTSYFFSLFACSVSKRVVSGTNGVLCNLTLQITDINDNVLASIETGDIPNAPTLTGGIDWTNYGVSFLSNGDKIKLKIYDHAGNGSNGNDLALDDISLIACHTKAPDINLKAGLSKDTTGLCGDSVTLKIDDLSAWEKIYPNTVYCLWQRSGDGGATWTTLDSLSGKSAQSIKVAMERNMQKVHDTLVNVGYRYRVIVAGPEADVTKQISTQGYPDNGCYLYGTSNESTVRCDCVDPVFAMTSKKAYTICATSTDSVKLSVSETNKAPYDSLNWYQRAKGTTAWTRIDTAKSMELHVLPSDTTEYYFQAVNGVCHSDTLMAKVNVNKAIKLAPFSIDTFCINSKVTVTAKVTAGQPTQFVWNGVAGIDSTYSIPALSKNETITVYATDGICTSDTLSKTVLKEDTSTIVPALRDTEVCKLTDLTFDSKAVGQKVQWYKTYSGTNIYKLMLTAKQPILEISADSSRTYKAVVSGVKCPQKEVKVNVKVNIPAEIKSSIDTTKICEGQTVTLTVVLDHVTTLGWKSRTDTNSVFTVWKQGTYSDTDTETKETLSPKVTTQYIVATPSFGCPTQTTPIYTVVVDQPIDFDLKTTDSLLCGGKSVTISGLLNAGMPSTCVFTRTTEDGVSTELPFTNYTYTVVPESTATYKVEMKGTYCPGTFDKDVKVTVEQPPVLSLAADKDGICEEGLVNLTLTQKNAIGVDWQSSTDGKTFTSFVTTDGQKQSPKQTTWYKVVSTGNKICPVAETNVQKVIVEDSIRYGLAATYNTICKGDAVTINAKLTTGKPTDVTFMRNKKGGTSVQLPFVKNSCYDIPDSTSTYVLSMSGTYCNTPVVKSVDVEVERPAILTLTADKTDLCVGSTVNISLAAQNANKLQWQSSTDGTNYTAMTVTSGAGLKPAVSTWYKVVNTGAKVCKSTESNILPITVEDSLRFTITEPDSAVCAGTPVGSQIMLTTGTPSSVLWQKSINGGAYSTIASDLVFSDMPTATTSYKAALTSLTCPSAEKTFTVAVQQLPVIRSLKPSSPTVCKNGELVLTVDQSNAQALVWEKRDPSSTEFTTISTDLINKVTDNPSTETLYRVRTTGSDACGNATSDQVDVTVEDSVKMTVTLDTTICPDSTLKLTAVLTQGTPKTITWAAKSATTDYTGVSGNTLNLIVSPKRDMTYQVTVKPAYCPAVTKTTNVNIAVIPTLVATASVNELCEGDAVNLTTTSSAVSDFSWKSCFTGQTVYAPLGTGATITDSPTKSMDYKVMGVSTNGCPVSSKPVTVKVDAQVTGVTNDTTICAGTSATLTIAPIGSYKYQWSTKSDYSDTVATTAKHIVRPTQTTEYYLLVTNGLCKLEKTMNVEVSQLPYFTAVKDMGVRELNFTADGGQGSYQYDFGQGWTSNSTFTGFRLGTNYTVYVKDAVGCKNDTTIVTPTYPIKVPNFFTPDGDADNETFTITNIEKYPDAIIRLYDRFGKLLLEAKGSTYTSWDGKYNGHDMPSTDYWYEIYIHEINKTYTGHFTLIRSDH